MDILALVGTGITLLLGIGAVWAKIDKVLIALRELADVIKVSADALSDKELTKEEIVSIKTELAQAIDAFKAVVQ